CQHHAGSEPESRVQRPLPGVAPHHDHQRTDHVHEGYEQPAHGRLPDWVGTGNTHEEVDEGVHAGTTIQPARVAVAGRRRLGAMRLRPDLWHLDPEVVHLNHGSFGAVPLPVLDAQRRAAEAIERSPERFYRVDLARESDAVRGRLADFLAVEPDSLALVQNATEAVQVALAAVDLQAGSEVVITDHAYGWVRAAVDRACFDSGAVVRLVTLPLPGGAGGEEDRGAGEPAGPGFAAQVTA